MAKSKKKTVQLNMQPIVEEEENNDDELDDLPLEAQDVIKALAELDGASDAKFKVWRIEPVPEGKVKGFCGTLNGSQFTMENVQKKYGKGTYRIIAHRSDGQYIKGGSKVLDIASDPPELTPAPQEIKSDKSEVIAMIESMNRREQSAAERNRELLLAAIPTIPAILAALFGNRSQSDPLQMIAALKTLAPQQPDMSGLVGKLIEIAAGKSDGGAETNWMDLVKEAIAQVGPMLGGKLLQPTAAPLIQSQQVPQAQITAQPPQPENPMLALIAWLKRTLSMLLDKAQRMKDPSLYADVVLDDVPDGVEVSQFVQYLNAENWWDTLVKFDLRVAPYRVWFSQFREDLLAAYEESQREFDEVDPNLGVKQVKEDEHPFATATIHEFKPGVTAAPENFFSELPPEFEPPSAS
jgi:hypothetical protein